MGASAVTPASSARTAGALAGMSSRLLRVAADDRLVRLVRDGSQPAFEVVYDRHHKGILSFCRHMLGSREEAEDAVQHTFMAAYKALCGSDKDIQLRPWLYAIARNRCLTVLRARREHPSDDIEIGSTDGLGAEVQRRADLREVVRDLAALPEEQRAALVLSELGGLGHDDVASVLDVPKDKVKALVFQARTSLHQSRQARDTPCEEIREALATLTGSALRRAPIRRHVSDCPGCQAFEADVKRQRRAMALILPVMPSIGLKRSALAAAFGIGGSGGGGAIVAAGGGGAASMLAKGFVVLALAGGGVAGVNAVRGGDSASEVPQASASEKAPKQVTGAPKPAVPATALVSNSTKKSAKRPARTRHRAAKKHHKRHKHAHKATPAKPGSAAAAPATAAHDKAKKAKKAKQAKKVKKAKRTAKLKKLKGLKLKVKHLVIPVPAPKGGDSHSGRKESGHDGSDDEGDDHQGTKRDGDHGGHGGD